MNDGQGYFAGKPAKPNDKEQQAGDEETQAVDAQTPGDLFNIYVRKIMIYL
ncbi:Os04g0219800 [Oryza sativa Japonica Group]|uniref:Uncharacterized protein n=3 Tax=Oryza sativa subsp. japonica TaxID=39947 RepID=A0A8J8XEE8_ORYSJ|nr:hypothetical protein OsJ_13875 [Oryza sativa Japonica Group]KAB8095019.1 hypothetical protein EE612_022587 [Oryza sativa]BAS88165.1 Os04g0219800 [Oryza sativa Japonica Group]